MSTTSVGSRAANAPVGAFRQGEHDVEVAADTLDDLVDVAKILGEMDELEDAPTCR